MFPKAPIATAQQFHDWFAVIDRAAAHNQEAHFRAHVAKVQAHLELCDSLAGSVDEVQDEVQSMLTQWRAVEEGGRALKDACERLLEERVRVACCAEPLLTNVQDRFLITSEAIAERLEYFSELEQAMRMLNHPGESLVLQDDFLLMVERVDVCLEYMKAHVRVFFKR